MSGEQKTIQVAANFSELSEGERAVHGDAIALTLAVHNVNLKGMAQDGSLVYQLDVALPPISKAQRTRLAPDPKALAQVMSTMGPPLVRIFVKLDQLHPEVASAIQAQRQPAVDEV